MHTRHQNENQRMLVLLHSSVSGTHWHIVNLRVGVCEPYLLIREVWWRRQRLLAVWLYSGPISCTTQTNISVINNRLLTVACEALFCVDSNVFHSLVTWWPRTDIEPPSNVVLPLSLYCPMALQYWTLSTHQPSQPLWCNRSEQVRSAGQRGDTVPLPFLLLLLLSSVSLPFNHFQ